jgi:hypothetical protein
MNSDDPKCQALAARQLEAFLAMRRLKKSLLDGKAYRPEITVCKFPQAKPANVATLRRRKT